MDEKTLEKKYTQAVKAAGGLNLKFTSPNMAGVPDRITILPGGHIGFVELKRPGKHPTKQQTHRHNQLRQLGATVIVLNNENNIGNVINEIQTT